MSNLILGTAGHIDHGKTSLVRALTGTDTDRLKEEKERGITIELGFAELRVEDQRFGVVDVPGHEAFVRAMVAGAAGMDVVVLVVAADEGIMPQTREHLAIVELLGVREVVVAVTKRDLVDDEWFELVEGEITDVLATGPFSASPIVPTSSTTGLGIEELRIALAAAGARTQRRGEEDIARLPLDRVFTIQGTGTVVTGTLWTGTLTKGDRVRILPQDLEARIRGLQVHGEEVDRAVAGDRTAVALTGDGADRDIVTRGATLVATTAWEPTWMLTAHVRMLSQTAWALAHNQRLRVHVGTAEVMARCALLESEPIAAGESGWVQLRLEAPVVARGGDRVVLRAYSPVTTIGGGIVAEPDPPKRNHLDAALRTALQPLVDGDPSAKVGAELSLAGWAGCAFDALPVRLGLTGRQVDDAVAAASAAGAIEAGGRWYSPQIADEAATLVTAAVDAEHAADPLRPVAPMAAVRSALPGWAGRGLADAVIERLATEGRLERDEGGVRSVGHRATLTGEQEGAAEQLLALLAASGLAAPFVDEIPAPLGAREDLWSLLRHLEGTGELTAVSDGYYVVRPVIEEAASAVKSELAGRSGLGPSEFREALPVTRKHLIPLLNHFDTVGVTLRREDGREVPA